LNKLPRLVEQTAKCHHNKRKEGKPGKGVEAVREKWIRGKRRE